MKSKLIYFFLFLLLICLIILYQVIYIPLDKKVEEEIIFKVEKGEGLFQVSKKLENKDLIKNNLPFEIYVMLRNDFDNLKRGSYKLSPSMSVAEIAQKIIKGDVINIKLTFIEGWNNEQVANHLERNNIFKKESFLESLKNYKGNSKLFKKIPESVRLEGYLFPDTYSIEEDISPSKLIKKMISNLQNKLSDEIGEDLSVEEKKLHEVIIMASLIEKEVKTYKDKRLVSGIAWKRIENNIPLQMDATIVYITGRNSTKIPLEETKIDSPYNTYKYKGLPPGPICNPGLESIKAALNPKESNYWYYLSAPSGETIFSKNLLEHNTAKYKYLK